MILNDILNVIKSAQKIIISTHIIPDGDCIGSSLGLYIALKRIGKDVNILLDDNIPDQYKFLPYCQEILHPEFAQNDSCDLFITLDNNDIDRLGKSKNKFYESKKTLCLDHHPGGKTFSDYNYINTSASATAEIVYVIIKSLSVNIDKDIADCLLTAIITDTGGFKFDNVTPYTFNISSDLLSCGADIKKINEMVFDRMSISKVKLLSRVLSTLEIVEDGKIGYVYLDENMLKECGASSSDSEGFINYIKNIDGVEIALIFKIEEQGIRISLRSKEYVNVNEIAAKFGGGGHKKASGCFIDKDFNTAKNIILDECRRSL
ncbi:MAG: bifunctional oligoribonuclease/PAP phosphatase NrnA [Thermoanaerobacteraceae bacterium]|nr:bifunctional oligoribonuclease/PAP phosphatase NrnA [Thermoanaerobacteraceae bacterium]